ncbi:hypothetical protein [Roseibium sp. MMSF_3544]|uniref:hypothetical protein n=1 Tax=unclassified Roseibium TaxID=2629323 RepID=UPI00274018EC|nr:hypothetical protein [Roseibium sp. MMSF_3544]
MTSETVPAVVADGSTMRIGRHMPMNSADATCPAILTPITHTALEGSAMLVAFQEWAALELAFEDYSNRFGLDDHEFMYFSRYNELLDFLEAETPTTFLDITVLAATTQLRYPDFIDGRAVKSACSNAIEVLSEAGLMPEPIKFPPDEIARLQKLSVDKKAKKAAAITAKQKEEVLREEGANDDNESKLPPHLKRQWNVATMVAKMFEGLNDGQQALAFCLIKRTQGIYD